MDVENLKFEEAPFDNPPKACGCTFGEEIWIWEDCEYKIENVISHETIHMVLFKEIGIKAYNTFDDIVKKVKELPR